MKIQAAVSRAPETPFTLEELDLVDPLPGEVLVRIAATGVCHTDLTAKGLIPAELGPVVLGHEGTGVVEHVGADVTGVVVGDRVVLSFSSCGACPRCAQGPPGYCVDFATLNGPGLRADGVPYLSSAGEAVLGHFFGQSSFATHAVVNPRNIVVVDEALDPALLAPLGCGVQTGAGAVMNVLRPDAGSSMAVYGAGSVGISALMAAVALGVGTTVAVDLSPDRRAAAADLGATHVVDPAEGDVVEQVRDLTGGGVDNALDTTGVPAVVAQGVRALAPLGTLVVVGLGAADVTFDIQDVLNNGKTLRGCIEGDAVPQQLVPELIRLQQQGRFPLEKIVSTYTLADINRAVDDARSGAVIKPVLMVDA